MNRNAIANHISSHTFLNILANSFRVLVSGIVLIFVARTLGPTQYGIVFLGLSVAAIAGLFFDFGITTSTACFLAEGESLNSLIYNNGRFLNLLFSLIFSVIFFSLSKPIAEFINIGSASYIQIICFLTLFTSLFRFSTKCLQGIKKTDKVALLNFVQSLITNILIFAAVYVGSQAIGVLLGHSISWVIIYLTSLLILRKYFGIFKLNLNMKTLKQIFFYALPLLVTSSSYFLLLRGPSILLSVFTSTKEVSYLHIPLRIVELISLPAYSLSIVATPFFTKKEQLKGNLSWLYVKIFKYYLLFYLPVAIFLALASKRIIHVAFGAEYSNAAGVLLILSFYIPFFAITNFSGTSLDFLGLAKQKSIIFAIVTASSITASFFIIPQFKEIGAALIIAVPYTLFSIYTIVRSSAKCGVNLTKYLMKVVTLLLVIITSSLPASITLYYFAGSTGLVISFICFISSFIILAIASKVFRIEEIHDLLKFIK